MVRLILSLAIAFLWCCEARASHDGAESTQGGGPNARQLNLFSPNPPIDPARYYVPGTGDPAVSTADYYGSDGLYWFRPFDLTDAACGAAGAAIAASRGRYFWVASPDHPNGNFGWTDALGFIAGYSNDPGIPPARMDRIIPSSLITLPAGQGYLIYQAPFLVCNPDDVDYPFYLYAEGQTYGGDGPHLQHMQGLARSNDLLTWTVHGPTHPNSAYAGWSSFQRVVRSRTGSWYSIGLTNPVNFSGFGKYISSDGRSFQLVSTQRRQVVGSSIFAFGPSDEVVIAGKTWVYVVEDAYDQRLPPNCQSIATCAPKARRIGMYVARVAIDGDWNVLASPAPVRVSTRYLGVYPGPTYLQAVSATVEDGIVHVWASHGFPPSSANQGLVNGATFANGGGLWQQFIDYYTETVDATAAARAAPFGVRASCAGGVVTLTWHDALPSRTYRVYRGAGAESQPTLISDVVGATATDMPTAGRQWWYKVVTLQNGIERGSRVVRVHASNATAFVNRHIDRVLADGGDPVTIDAAFLSKADALLTSLDLHKHLHFWTDPKFGVKRSGSTIASIYDLGTTRLPRGGDYTPATSRTSYGATGINRARPGWINTDPSSFGYFGGGKLNNIRRQTQIGVCAVYQKPHAHTATFLASGEFGGMSLQHIAGAPGEISFSLSGATSTVAATVAARGATTVNIVCGNFDGTHVTAYSEGVAGSGQPGLEANTDLSLRTFLRGQWGTADPVRFLGAGSKNSKHTGGRYVFSDSQAQFTGGALLVFDQLTAEQIAAITVFYRIEVGP